MRDLLARWSPPRRQWRWIALTLVSLVLVTWVIQVDQLWTVRSVPYSDGRIVVPSVHDDIEKEYGGQIIEPEKLPGRVLVTGGGGMIGKQIVARLLASGTPVTVLDRIFYEDEVDAIRAHNKHADLRVVRGDIRDADVLQQAMTKDVVGVIHLAAVSRVLWCLENEKDCLDVNVDAVERVIEAFKGGWFIQASSREVYGNAKNQPVPEDTPHQAANIYGDSKAKAEDVIQRHVRKVTEDGSKNINAVLLRLSNVYGSSADHRERLIPAIMTNALSHRPIQIVGGDQDLDMVNIADVVNAVSLAVTRLKNKGSGKEPRFGEVDIFNVGTDRSTSALSLIKKILWLTNSSSPVQTLPGDNRFPDKYVGSTKHSAEVLGFKAAIGIDEGLHRLAMQYLVETRDYLQQKQKSVCEEKKEYGPADLLALNGCSGVLAADVEGQPFYAAFYPHKDDKPESLGWQDSDEPQEWHFEVTKGAGGVSLRLKQLVKTEEALNKEIYFTTGAKVARDASFTAAVDPATGYVKLSTPSGPLVPWGLQPPTIGDNDDKMPDPQKTALGEYRFRITPFCCPNKASPWPFFKDDPLASNILDFRLEKRRLFNVSQIDTLCSRLRHAQDLAESRIARLQVDPRPIKLQETELPTGKPADWRLRKLDVCTNLCDHPTVCVDTGNCACGQGSCSPRLRFPFAEFANLPYLSYPPPKFSLNWEAVSASDPAALAGLVDKSSWLNVLRPGARRFLSRKPEFPAVNVTRLPEEIEKERADDPDRFDRVQTEWHGCYSADSVMERGAKALSKPYTSNELVFMPHWDYTLRFPPTNEWIQNAVDNNLPTGFDVADMIIPFTFDWGRCHTILHGLYRVRDWSGSIPKGVRASSWQPMGDLNSPCYFMDQDVVIPARTCLQEDLRKRFGDLTEVKPAKQRDIFMHFKGSPNGAGSSVRQKLVCARPYHSLEGKLTGANTLPSFLGSLRQRSKSETDAAKIDYLDTIGDSIFCPVPRGTTGWATRTIDVIYAGCIPVLLGDQTHHPYWDVLDWAKFSVQVNDYDIEHIEAILMSYSWEEISRMQTNLMLVRDAFLYPAEGNMAANLVERGPFFYAMHSAALLQQTRFPV